MSSAMTSESIYAELGLPDSPVLVDVRSEDDYAAAGRVICGSLRGSPDHVAHWARSLPRSRSVCVYCSHGGDRSQAVAKTLSAMGLAASFLEGGFEQWRQAGRVTCRVRPELNSPGGSRWVTRERPKIDRVACPWLVRRFIDPGALFFYSPPHRVRAEAEALGGQPYDIADVTFSHRGKRCSFDAFLDEFDVHDPVIDQVAAIVRSADTGQLADAPQAPGLLAISLGLSALLRDDVLLLEQAMSLYDALYAWCKKAHDEAHSWPQKAN